jgi:hypothetical protein
MTQRHGAIGRGISLVIIWKYVLVYKVQFSVVVDDEEAKLRTKESLAMSSTILLILRPVMMLYIGRISAGEA